MALHPCFKEINFADQDVDLDNFKFKCEVCNNFGTNTRRSLTNQLDMHKSRDEKRARQLANPTRQKSSKYVSSRTNRHSRGAGISDIHGFRGPSPPRRFTQEPTASIAMIIRNSQFPSYDEDDDTPPPTDNNQEDILCNPDEPVPSDPFISKLREILDKYSVH